MSVRKGGMFEWCLRAGSTCASSGLHFKHMPHSQNLIQYRHERKPKNEGVNSFQSDQGLYILHLHFQHIQMPSSRAECFVLSKIWPSSIGQVPKNTIKLLCRLHQYLFSDVYYTTRCVWCHVTVEEKPQVDFELRSLKGIRAMVEIRISIKELVQEEC